MLFLFFKIHHNIQRCTSVALPKILVASEVEKLEQFYFVIQKILYCGAELTFQSELHLSVKNPMCKKDFPSSYHT